MDSSPPCLAQTAVQDELFILVKRFQPVLGKLYHTIKIYLQTEARKTNRGEQNPVSGTVASVALLPPLPLATVYCQVLTIVASGLLVITS